MGAAGSMATWGCPPLPVRGGARSGEHVALVRFQAPRLPACTAGKRLLFLSARWLVAGGIFCWWEGVSEVAGVGAGAQKERPRWRP